MNKKCPYPGLRPFTEQEAIYFKGRDMHIKQIIRILEEKKITMLTGASGDGKSSLVYAGVVPYARAGFFKSQYSNWTIVDFRPERSPLQNLTQVLTEKLNIDYKKTLFELEHGFSSLASVYKDSEKYIDLQKTDWVNLSAAEKEKHWSKAANILIIADQFEEMFTNTENYSDGVPSDEAYTTVNLLLETARIAIQENLPIYVVLTMRSDYISQTVAFKDLPEFIGYSQFFVPRLNRTEVMQVISEPAKLAGGQITNRLTEYIINELGNKFDQLPVLQHILNRLWMCADQGNETIDFVHLAMIAGISSGFLAPEDKTKFDAWLQNQPESALEYYRQPGLHNVLNTHVNTLYNSAFTYFSQNPGYSRVTINNQESLLILKTAFKSLTKIDDGRTVRNRISLYELTNIINKPHITSDIVLGILNIFRLPENTFLRPFLSPGHIETEYLDPDAILDITHEAFIRNWKLIETWEKEELDNYNDFLDFKVQLNRWISNNKSSAYLLAPGPLSYYENWYNRCEPNPYWYAKYDNDNKIYNHKVAASTLLYELTIDFLTESRNFILAAEKARKKRVTLAAITAIIVIFVLSGLSFWAYKQRNDANEQRLYAENQTKVANEQRALAEKQKNEIIAANILIEQERDRANKKADEAEFARKQEEIQRLIANAKTLEAYKKAQELLLANNEIKRTNQQYLHQKEIAEAKTKEAFQKADSLHKMNQLTLAKSLSAKAQSVSDTGQINYLLALYAYQLTQKNDKKNVNSEIFDVLKSVVYQNDSVNTLNLKNSGIIKAFYIFKNNTLLTINSKAEITKYSFTENRAKIEKKYSKFKLNSVIEKAIFLTHNQIVFSDEAYNSYFIDLEKNLMTKLKSITSSYIRGARISPDSQMVAIGTMDGQIIIWHINKLNEAPFHVGNIKEKISKLTWSGNSKFLFIANGNGNLMKYEIKTGKNEEILKDGLKSYALITLKNKDLIAVGLNNGTVKLLNGLNDDKQAKILMVSLSRIEDLVYNETSKLLAIATADKKITLINIENTDEKPIVINDNRKSKQLFLNQTGRVFSLSENNYLRYWETETDKYLAIVKKHVTRSFTKEEWNFYVGEEFEYVNILQNN